MSRRPVCASFRRTNLCTPLNGGKGVARGAPSGGGKKINARTPSNQPQRACAMVARRGGSDACGGDVSASVSEGCVRR